MCWMAVHRGDGALTNALEGCREHEHAHGGDSWGYAVARDGRIYIEKDVGAVPDGVDSGGVDAALAHTRLATKGEVSERNAHPFAVRDEAGEVVAALAHNGTWYGAPTRDGRCDSYYIARVLEEYLQDDDLDFEQAVRRTGDHTGETITVLRRDGSAYAYSGRMGITSGDGWIRSSGGEHISTGEVKSL